MAFLLVKLHNFLHTTKHFLPFFAGEAEIMLQKMLCNTKMKLRPFVEAPLFPLRKAQRGYCFMAFLHIIYYKGGSPFKVFPKPLLNPPLKGRTSLWLYSKGTGLKSLPLGGDLEEAFSA